MPALLRQERRVVGDMPIIALSAEDSTGNTHIRIRFEVINNIPGADTEFILRLFERIAMKAEHVIHYFHFSQPPSRTADTRRTFPRPIQNHDSYSGNP